MTYNTFTKLSLGFLVAALIGQVILWKRYNYVTTN